MPSAVSTAVIWALPDVTQESALVAAAPVAGLRIVRRCVDAADLLAHASIDTMTTVVVSEGVPRLDGDIVRRLMNGQRPVVGVARTAAGAGRLRAWGVAVVVELDDADGSMSLARIARACQDTVIAKRTEPPIPAAAATAVTAEDAADIASEDIASEDDASEDDVSPIVVSRPADGREREHAVIAVWAPPGSPGCTTTSVGMADELARQGRRVLLVDADVRSPSLALMLGITDDAGGLLLAARQADHGLLSARTLAQCARAYRAGLAVLTGLPRPDRRGELRASALDAIWTHARDTFDVTVVDLGAVELSQREHSLLAEEDGAVAARSVLAAADAVVVVARGDALGLSRLAQSRLPRSAAVVAVVDPPRRTRGHAVDVITDLGLALPAVRVGWERSWADALCAGATLTEMRPRARARRAYRTLAEQALAAAA